jgi:hypothetical protein
MVHGVTCDLGPCAKPARFAAQVLVEGRRSVVRACQRHADWLRVYVEQDPYVRLIGEIFETTERSGDPRAHRSSPGA